MIELYARMIEGMWFGVAYEEENVYSTWFGPDEKSTVKGLLASIPSGVSFHRVAEASVFADRVISAVNRIYDGKDVSVKFGLATKHLPDYTRKVLEAVYLIPPGYMTSYGLIAKAVGGGARAVGNVMAANPFAPIVPCHRVVRSDLTLGGYGGGLDLKAQMLRRERRGYVSEKEIRVIGKRLRLFPVEMVLDKLEKRGK